MPDGRRFPGLRSGWVLPLLAITTLLIAKGATADICGYPERGTLTVNREGQAVAAFRVGLAEKPSEHRQGLMGCPDLAPGSGLLFVYPDARRHVFWMKNTPLALAIVFISAGGRIAAIEKGFPFSTDRIRSPDGIQYVLEINAAEGAAIEVGDRITLGLTAE